MSEYIIPVEMEVDDGQAAFNMEIAEQINIVSGTDVSDTTAVEEDVLSGKKFHKANGDLAIGTFSIPTPTNLITNGDFSAAGATTDGWYALSPQQSTIAVSDGKLVLTHTATSNRAYGIYYPISIESGHSYLVRFKVTKTMNDSDSDSRYITIRFLNGTTYDYLSTLFFKNPVTQDSIVESVGAVKAPDNYDKIFVGFNSGITTDASNESMLALWYIELYDITDIIAGW